MDTHVVDLRTALDQAFAEIYGDEDRTQAIRQIDEVIQSVAQSKKPEEDARNRTSRFLASFIDYLAAR